MYLWADLRGYIGKPTLILHYISSFLKAISTRTSRKFDAQFGHKHMTYAKTRTNPVEYMSEISFHLEINFY